MNILIDTREKESWNFDFFNECTGVKRQALKTGDYTIEGLEDTVILERKRTVGEIAINLGKKSKQFQAELERMQSFRFRYIICEFSLDDIERFPEGSGIPKSKWKYIRMNSGFIQSRLNSLAEKYGVEIRFCGNKDQAIREAINIFNEVIDVVESEKF